MLERRQHKRFKGNPDTFVFSKMHPGRIKDISMGGMAFSYLYDRDDCQSIDCLSLFDKENHFFLENVSCRTVGNAIENNRNSFSAVQTGRKHVAFNLTPSQSIQLEDYIQAHSCGQI